MKKEKVKRIFELGYFFVVGIKSFIILKSYFGWGDDFWVFVVFWLFIWNLVVVGGGGISVFIFLIFLGFYVCGGFLLGLVNFLCV